MREPRVPFTRRLTFGRLLAIDMVASVLLAFALVGSALAPRRVPLHLGVPVGVGIALACVACAGVGLRRWRPLTALALALPAEAVMVFLGFIADPMIAVAAVLYVVALVKPTRDSNTDIAQQLHLTVATVKSHVGRLLMKLQARDRAQLVIAAYQAGMVP